MITSESLEHLLERSQLPAMGREYLKRVATSPPSRRVRSAGTNVICRFPSRKMGLVIQAESHRNELALLYVLEHDPDVIAYWDQPEGIKITYESASGRPTSPTITPDYLVLRKNRVELVEVKPADALPELSKEMPRRYVCAADGHWHSPPAEAAASTYGFAFQIWTSAQLNPIWLQNIKALADYFGTDASSVPPETRKNLKEAVQSTPGLSLEMLRQACNEASADHINLLIVHEELYIDLAAAPLIDLKRVRVYSSREVAETLALLSKTVSVNGASSNRSDSLLSQGNLNAVCNGSGTSIETSSNSCINDITQGVGTTTTAAAAPSQLPILQLSHDAARLFRRASPDDLAIANKRYRILTESEFAKQNPVPKRTLRQWRRLFRLAEERYGYGLLGLIPCFKDRGNHRPRFSDELLKLVDRIIETVYCTPTRPNKRHAYDRLRLECEQKGHITPSYTWFTKRIERRSKYSLALTREGKRVAHRYELIRPGEPNDNHGAFPWDICLTDHTQTDVELVCSETGENLGRPWLSILVDGFSRRILTFVLTFDSPSYRTLMMLARSCVEQHGRLPGCLVVDGAKEFQSVYFETLTAAYGVMLKRRPGGKARFGTIIERVFGTINTTFLHTLTGNTQNTKNIRAMVKSMNPKGHAAYCLEELHDMLSVFAFDYYDKRPHPAVNCSPAEKYMNGIEISGAREHKAIAFDEAFRLLTLPSTPKGTARIQTGMGIKIRGFYYWASEMRTRHLESKSVRVKYDPEDAGVAWAYLEDAWVQCRSSTILNLAGRTEKEMRIAVTEWRRSRQLLGYRQANSQKAFAEFLKTTEAAKALRIQQSKDRALRRANSKNRNSEPTPSGDSVPTTNSIPLTQTPPADGPPEPPQPTVLPPTQDYGDF